MISVYKSFKESPLTPLVKEGIGERDILSLSFVKEDLASGSDGVVLNKNENQIELILKPKKDEFLKVFFDFSKQKEKVDWGGSLKIQVDFEEENSRVEVYGLYVLQDQNDLKIDILINHQASKNFSKVLVKGVLNDDSKVDFVGKILVGKNGQKTEAELVNKNLVLSEDVDVSTKPELEIENDDVKCNHGATVGYLNPDELFYLKSRGLNEEISRDLLTQSFVSEVLINKI
jgi:hypothetical protein